MRNFTVADTLGIVQACFILLPFMFAPGYVAGWTLDLFEFRQRRPVLRLILAVPLTIAICPMLSYLLARFLEPEHWVFYIGMFTACAVLLAKDARRVWLRRAPKYKVTKYEWMALGLLALWGIAAIGSLVDLQIGDRLYPSIVAYDHSVRTAMTAALARHVPPNNPFLANAAPLRYHYLWLLFCSLPMKVIHLAAAVCGVFRRRLVRSGPALHNRARPQVSAASASGHRANNVGRDCACSALPASTSCLRCSLGLGNGYGWLTWSGETTPRSPPGLARYCGCRTTSPR